jgi:signal transduction histidine kinase
VGVIVLSSDHPGRTFGDEERALLALVAQHAAIVIENARLFRAERDRGAQLEALRATTADLTRELDLTRLLRLLIARAAELVGASSATVYLWEPAQALVVPAAWHGLGDYQATIRHGLGQGIAGTVAQTRQGLCVNDYRTSRYANPVTLHHTAVTASMGEPLFYRDELIGALTLNHESGRTFSAQDQAVLRLFADQAAIAIKNARLYTAAQQALTDLRQAQDGLIRTEKLRGLGQMAAGIAHDLNNTLATILGQVELLRLQARPPEIDEGLQTLQTAATDGAVVVRRLQDFARQRGGGPLTPCDLTQVVTEALEITRPRWREETRRKGISIEASVDLAGLARIEGHPAEIREALTNLIFNAVDAMPDGGHLRFTGRVVEAPEGNSPAEPPGDLASPRVRLDTPPPAWVELTVADTGIGMTDEILGRIFDPFFTTKGLHGTGLGLSVVYGTMERHGGRIDVTSAPGQGTAVRLRFRAAPRDATAASPRSTPALARRRILVVDDDAPVRHTLASLLRASGQEVVEADSGAEALRWLETTAVDLVLTDLGMPDVTGWDVARAAKARHPDLPVVLLTGWGDQVGTEAPPGVRVDRVLTKPVPRSAVLAVIAELSASR